jgi:hypothetical protein
MNKQGKEGGEAVMFPVFLFILIIIGVGIVAGVFIFFGGDIDYRVSDASLLYTKVARCLSQADLSSKSFDDLYSICGISEKVLKDNRFVLQIYDSGNVYLKTGDIVQCELQDRSQAYPRCISGIIYATLNKQHVFLNITAGSNQEASS